MRLEANIPPRAKTRTLLLTHISNIWEELVWTCSEILLGRLKMYTSSSHSCGQEHWSNIWVFLRILDNSKSWTGKRSAPLKDKCQVKFLVQILNAKGGKWRTNLIWERGNSGKGLQEHFYSLYFLRLKAQLTGSWCLLDQRAKTQIP